MQREQSNSGSGFSAPPPTVFLLLGLLAGITSVALGPWQPTVLAFGVGPLFFCALLAALALTNSWSHVTPGIWKHFVGLCLCTATYFLAFLAFVGVGGYAPDVLGVRSSADISDFHADVLVGLLAAAVVASIGMELLGYILTGRWSSLFLAFFLTASVISLLMTYLIRAIAIRYVHTNSPVLIYWAFLGTLLTVGQGLFCGLLGAQILMNPPRASARTGGPVAKR